MNPFAGPTFYLPILYGAGLIKLFGFSFTLLRLSTLALTLFTLIILYFFLNKISKNPKLSFLGALTLWLNPIFYNLSFTFMTDIPALLFIIASVYAYYVGFEKNNKLLLLLGGLISIAGFFIRQTNILVLIAAGIYALTQLKKNNPVIPAKAGIQPKPVFVVFTGFSGLSRGNDNNTSFKHLLWIFGIPALVWLAVYYFLFSRELLSQAIGSHAISGPFNLFKHGLWWLWYSLIYIGFFTAPFFIGWSVNNIREFKKIRLALPIIFSLLIAAVIYLSTKDYFPYIPNIINRTGLGPLASVLNGETIPLFSGKIYGAFTLLFAAAGAWSFYYLWPPKKEREENINTPQIFFFIQIIFFLIPILFLESFDRYFLPIFFFTLAVMISNLNKQKLSGMATAVVLTLYAIFSISQTAFYLNWNNARWELAATATPFVSASHQIDAGFEWNGWHSYWSARNSGLTTGTATSPWWIRSLFMNNTEDYIVAFSPIRPYTVIKIKIVPGLNPNNHLYLLKK